MLTVLRHSQRSVWTSECRVATGRSAILLLILAANPKGVLMPCYVPEGVITPFQKAGIPIKFYKLRGDLRPDLDHVTRLITKGDLFVLIHYFGYQTETGALREIVSNAEGILFEDCAQALFAKALDADVALWSLNKFLPVVDGAILRSRRRDIVVTPPALYVLPIHNDTRTAYHQHLTFNARIAVSNDRAQVTELIGQSNAAYENYYSQIQDLALYAQSDESRCIEDSTDLAAMQQIRSHNTSGYYKFIPQCFRFRPKIPVAPFAYPIIVRSPYSVLEIIDCLIDIGVLPARQVDKWDHIPTGDNRFEHERTFMEQHLLLPVGEEVTFDDVKRIGTCLREISNAY